MSDQEGSPKPADKAPSHSQADQPAARQDSRPPRRPRRPRREGAPEGTQPTADSIPQETPEQESCAPASQGERPRRSGRNRGGDRKSAPQAPAPAIEAAEVPREAETPREPYVAKTEFGNFGLDDRVVQAVEEAGYVTPTEIQSQGIPLLLEGRDIIGASQTGTGKTAAFALPIISRLARHGRTRALILEPTRELAQQVRDQFVKYGAHTNLRLALLHGGVGYGRQRDEIRAVPDVIIATPGRLLDFLHNREVSFKDIEFLVLDEGDRMLDMGFMPDVRRIIGMCPPKRQSLLFSATAEPEIQRLAGFMLKDPVRVAVGGGTAKAETVRHALLPVDDRQKFNLLVHLLEKTEYNGVIIFSRTKVGADQIARWLEQRGIPDIAVIHADRAQREREVALAKFREGKCTVLVATDIMSRGIDISGVSHVINYDVPENAEDYVHRIGRTGRMRKEGDAYTLYTPVDTDRVRAIERLINQKIPREKLEGFDYAWSPIFNEGQPPAATKRNRGAAGIAGMGFGRRRR